VEAERCEEGGGGGELSSENVHRGLDADR
jgi:hypothetical protein